MPALPTAIPLPTQTPGVLVLPGLSLYAQTPQGRLPGALTCDLSVRRTMSTQPSRTYWVCVLLTPSLVTGGEGSPAWGGEYSQPSIYRGDREEIERLSQGGQDLEDADFLPGRAQAPLSGTGGEARIAYVLCGGLPVCTVMCTRVEQYIDTSCQPPPGSLET